MKHRNPLAIFGGGTAAGSIVGELPGGRLLWIVLDRADHNWQRPPPAQIRGRICQMQDHRV